jgi:hypothetical protein
MTQKPVHLSDTLPAIQRAARLSSNPPVSEARYSITGPAKHTIEPTVFEREDGMAIMKVKVRGRPWFWVLRAPVKGPTFFWNGRAWVINTLIERGITDVWPNEFRFSKEVALSLLEDLDAPP